jgi:hypothetical protein
MRYRIWSMILKRTRYRRSIENLLGNEKLTNL